MKKVFVTSALPYANGSIHIGHLVEYIQTDIYCRFRKMLGDDVVYVCADDTHGTPIEVNARSRGITPEELVAYYAREHKEDFDAFAVGFDIFYSTNSDENRKYSELIFSRLKEKGHIIRKKIPLNWCETDRRYLPDRYIKGRCPKCGAADQYGDVCEKCNSTYDPTDLVEPFCVICGGKPEVREADHYFFRLADFTGPLKAWTTKEGSLQEEIRNYVNVWVNEGLKDWCISRNGPYFGFKIPGEDDLYFYVWLDAPIGYFASLDRLCRDTGRNVDEYLYGDGAETVHFVGKDIIYFHALFWPAMLMGAGFKAPDHLFVHGMLTVNGEKMSKSRGTFITARQYIKSELDPQYLRYYYAANLSARPDDLDLNLTDFENRINAELVGNISNFAYRTLSYCMKQFEGKVTDYPDGAPTAEVMAVVPEIRDLYAAREFRKAIQKINVVCDRANKYYQDSQPWALVKKDPAAAQKVISWCTAMCKVLAVLLKPVLPGAAQSLEAQLGLHPLKWADATFDYRDRQIAKAEMLAVKVNESAVVKMQALASVPDSTGPGKVPSAAEPVTFGPEITYDDFAKIDLRAAEILEAERVPKSKKLIRMIVDCGERRQIVAGIGEAYTPENLVGKKIVVVANLKTAMIMGVESKGMLLAATSGKDLFVVELPNETVNGGKVK